MIRARTDFVRLAANGRTRADLLMVVHFAPNELDHDRFGISTGRRLGGAVSRNRVRRRLREILRVAPNDSGRGWDILIVARPACVGVTFDELRAALMRLLALVREASMASS